MTSLRLIGEAVVDDDEEPTFAAFWLLYPKKVAKFKAELVWNKLKRKDQVDAMVALIAWRQVWMARREMEFVPYPSTWLYQQRWTDELPENWGGTHGSHAAAQIPESGERTRMPEHVRAAIARLKK